MTALSPLYSTVQNIQRRFALSRFLVLYRGGDASKLSPKENEILSKKWSLYREKLVKAGALKEGGRVQSSAATQLVGKAREIKEKRVGNHASFVDGYCLLEGKSMQALQRLSKTCPHLTMMDGTIEIIPVIEEALAAPAESA